MDVKSTYSRLTTAGWFTVKFENTITLHGTEWHVFKVKTESVANVMKHILQVDQKDTVWKSIKIENDVTKVYIEPEHVNFVNNASAVDVTFEKGKLFRMQVSGHMKCPLAKCLSKIGVLLSVELKPVPFQEFYEKLKYEPPFTVLYTSSAILNGQNWKLFEIKEKNHTVFKLFKELLAADAKNSVWKSVTPDMFLWIPSSVLQIAQEKAANSPLFRIKIFDFDVFDVPATKSMHTTGIGFLIKPDFV